MDDNNDTELSEQQLDAIEYVVIGCTDQETANVVGVDRTTIWRWRHHHPRFKAELERRRAARRDAIRRTADHLDFAAMSLLQRQIQAGNLTAAIQYLRLRLGGLFGFGIPQDETSGTAAVDALAEAVREVVPPEQWKAITEHLEAALGTGGEEGA